MRRNIYCVRSWFPRIKKQEIKLPFSQQYEDRNVEKHCPHFSTNDGQQKYLQSNNECWKWKMYFSDRVQQTILRTHKNTLTCLRCQMPNRKWSMERSKLVIGHITVHKDPTTILMTQIVVRAIIRCKKKKKRNATKFNAIRNSKCSNKSKINFKSFDCNAMSAVHDRKIDGKLDLFYFFFFILKSALTTAMTSCCLPKPK